MQSKRQSLIESTTSVALGYGIALITQRIVFPVFNIYVNADQNLQIAAIFTLVSLARSYVVRRVFNWYHVRKNRVIKAALETFETEDVILVRPLKVGKPTKDLLFSFNEKEVEKPVNRKQSRSKTSKHKVKTK